MNLNSVTNEQWVEIQQLIGSMKGNPKDFYQNPKTELNKRIVQNFETLKPGVQIVILLMGIEISPFCILGFMMALAFVAQAEMNEEKTNETVTE